MYKIEYLRWRLEKLWRAAVDTVGDGEWQGMICEAGRLLDGWSETRLQAVERLCTDALHRGPCDPWRRKLVSVLQDVYEVRSISGGVEPVGREAGRLG